MVSEWLMKAFELEMDIAHLLDSRIMSTICDENVIEHWGKWPQFHKNLEKMSINYEGSIISLMHDE